MFSCSLCNVLNMWRERLPHEIVFDLLFHTGNIIQKMSKWEAQKVKKERFFIERDFSKKGRIKSARRAFTRTLFFTFTLLYTSFFNFVKTMASLILNVVSFEIFFSDWIMYSLLQISFQERFELYRNQLANWQC